MYSAEESTEQSFLHYFRYIMKNVKMMKENLVASSGRGGDQKFGMFLLSIRMFC